jgi:hypothetical protein
VTKKHVGSQLVSTTFSGNWYQRIYDYEFNYPATSAKITMEPTYLSWATLSADFACYVGCGHVNGRWTGKGPVERYVSASTTSLARRASAVVNVPGDPVPGSDWF